MPTQSRKLLAAAVAALLLGPAALVGSAPFASVHASGDGGGGGGGGGEGPIPTSVVVPATGTMLGHAPPMRSGGATRSSGAPAADQVRPRHLLGPVPVVGSLFRLRGNAPTGVVILIAPRLGPDWDD
jgi:hypothetical protein